MQEKNNRCWEKPSIARTFLRTGHAKPIRTRGNFSFASNQTAPSKTLSEFILLHVGIIEFYENQPGICSSPDGGWIAKALAGSLRLWRGETNSWFINIGKKLAAPFTDCALSPDGKYLGGKLSSGHLLLYPTLEDFNSHLKEIKKEDFFVWKIKFPTFSVS